MRCLSRILPAHEAVRKNSRTHPGKMSATNLLVFSKSPQRTKVTMRTQHDRTQILATNRTIQITRAIKPGQSFERHVFD